MRINDLVKSIRINDPEQTALIKARKALAQKILGAQYDGLYDFFCDVIESSAAYKILRARRCQVLFELFLPIVLFDEYHYESEEKVDFPGDYFSSNALEKNVETFRGSSVLIVDDILIHGRGIRDCYEQLDPKYAPDSDIHIMVYYKAIDAKYISEKLEQRFEDNYCLVYDRDWRDFSCRIVELINASVLPYASFIGSYEYKGCIESYGRFINIFNWEKKEYNSRVLFEEETVPKFFKKVSFDACLRVYSSPSLNMTAYVPFVFLKNFRDVDAATLIDAVLSCLKDDGFTLLKRELRSKKINKKYQMSLFSAFVNQVYYVYLVDKYADVLTERCIPMRWTLELCFGSALTDEILGVCYKDIMLLLESERIPDFPSATIVEDATLNDYYYETIRRDLDESNADAVYEALAEYYFKNGQLDEMSVSKLAPRKKGLSMDFFYCHNGATKQKENRCALTASHLKCWDLGIASGIMRASDEGVIALYGVAGEQSFRYILEKYQDFFDSLLQRYNQSFIDPNKRLDDSYIDSLIKEKGENDLILKAFIQDHRGHLTDWLIPRMLINSEN